jgi:hypothetical protein
VARHQAKWASLLSNDSNSVCFFFASDTCRPLQKKLAVGGIVGEDEIGEKKI